MCQQFETIILCLITIKFKDQKCMPPPKKKGLYIATTSATLKEMKTHTTGRN